MFGFQDHIPSAKTLFIYSYEPESKRDATRLICRATKSVKWAGYCFRSSLTSVEAIRPPIAETHSLSYLNKAKSLIENIKDIPELKSTILFQMAQTQIYSGDVIKAEQNQLSIRILFEKVEINSPLELIFIIPEQYEICN